MSRRLYEFTPFEGKSTAKDQSVWFTCCCLAQFADSKEQFIAVATNDGHVFSVELLPGRKNFQQNEGFVVKNSEAILGMSFDLISQKFALATPSGAILFL